jgi:signal transduction histidine kinase
MGMTEDTDGDRAECLANPPKLVRIRNFQIVEEFPKAQIFMGRLAADSHGGIWLGTATGQLLLFRRGVLQTTEVGVKGPPNYLRAQADGSVLAAYQDGLVGLRRGKVQRLTPKNGLPCSSVYGFIQDKQARWWINTECGIVELPDSELQRWWADPETIVKTRLFDTLDGARPRRASFDPAALSPDGRVWFAGLVVQMLDPSKVFSQKVPPAETYVDAVTVDRKEFAATGNLRVPPHPRDLQIDYTSPTFLIPQRVRFRYRLDGFDRDWYDAGTRRQAFYNDLPPGKYAFRVIACNGEGAWDDSPAKLDFSITPAYYQTTWFRSLCALAFLALFWAAYQWRVRHLHHEFEMTLDARVGERTRIARELHDTLLQSFHGLLLRLQAVSQILRERPVEAQAKLDSTIEQAAVAITEGRDAVQGLRDSTVQMNDLGLAISTLGEELTTESSNHRPAFHVAVEGASGNLHPIVRDEVYKIAAEALRNAFRHSDARVIEVEIRYDNEQFRLRVRDDGKGMNPAVLSQEGVQGHCGIPGMRERAETNGGKLRVWSEVNAGTEVELRLPANVAYSRARRPSWFSRAFGANPQA